MDGRRQQREAWLLLAPAVVILAVVTVWPLARTVWLSFTDAKITALKDHVHWSASRTIPGRSTDPYFLKALVRTFYFTILGRPREVIAVAVALLLNQNSAAATCCAR